MPGIGRGPAAREADTLGHLCFERPRAAPRGYTGSGTREIYMNDRAGLRLTQLGLQSAKRCVDPSSRRRLVVQIALDPLRHARRTQRGEAFVEHPAGLAELCVGAIAQRQYRITQAFKARRIVGHQRGEEIDRALRRVALAPRAGDHQQVLRAGDLRRGGIRHVKHPRGEAELAGSLARGIGQRLGVTGLGGEQDGQRCPSRRRCRGGRLWCGCRLIPGEEPAQPSPLLGVRPRDDLVQLGDLIRRKWRGLRQHGVLLQPAAQCPARRRAAAAARRPGR